MSKLFKKKLLVGVMVLSFFGTILNPANILANTDILKYSEKIKEVDDGTVYKVLVDGVAKNVIVYDDGTIKDYPRKPQETNNPNLIEIVPDQNDDYYKEEKVNEEVDSEPVKKEEEMIDILGVWIGDSDINSIEDEWENAGVTIEEGASQQEVQQYIQEKRDIVRKRYIESNNAYCKKYLANEKVLFVSEYAPFVIVKLKNKNPEELPQDGNVTNHKDYYSIDKKEEVSYSVPNIQADYTRSDVGLTGKGVKIGILEMSYPDLNNAQLKDRDIKFDVEQEVGQGQISTHATKVVSIIAGKTEGIAPDSTVYCAASKNRIDDFKKIEWLISKGVNVINYSAGYENVEGMYSDMARWIDYLTFLLHVNFIKSAGNCGPYDGITDPGMAYNVLTIGSISDKDSSNEPNWSDDCFMSESAYIESEAGFKPDLTAPGDGIKVAGFPASSGTSYAAPHVAGVIAQLLELKNDLLWKTSALNALLKAGTFHKTAKDYGEYQMSPDYSDKEGAGVIDALGAYEAAKNNQYVQVTMPQENFPYQKDITIDDISKPVRVALHWLKQEGDFADFLGDLQLGDLDLYVYGPDGNLVKSSCSANNNTELVEFLPTVKGEYKVIVQSYLLNNPSEVIGLSWSQKNSNVKPKEEEDSKIEDSKTEDPKVGEKPLELYNRIFDWGDEYIIHFDVTNTSNHDVQDWSIRLLKSQFDVKILWNGEIKEEGNEIILSPLDYNQTIKPGQTVSIGFQCTGSIVPDFIYDFSMR